MMLVGNTLKLIVVTLLEGNLYKNYVNVRIKMKRCQC